MRRPTSIIPVLVNVTLNPYLGKRPKIPVKKYNIETMFNEVAKRTYPLKLSNGNHNFVDYILIDSASACLPGGRGCTGKERHGTHLLNRQVATKNIQGLRINPKVQQWKTDRKTILQKNKTKQKIDSIYGFLQFTGTIHYKDGSIGNLSIPVDSSGTIGIRTGTSKQAIINPDKSNAGILLNKMIIEIESLIFNYVNVKKERDHRVEMINSNFNLYTDKKKSDRPKLTYFVPFLKEMHKIGLNKEYKSPSMPWLQHQGGPVVIKGTFKPLPTSNLATITISPFGHVEILGGKSFEQMVSIYKLVTSSFYKVSSNISETYKEEVNVNNTPKRRYTKKTNKKTINKGVLSLDSKGQLKINNKRCIQMPKPDVVSVAKYYGIASQGTKTILCDRLKKVMNTIPVTQNNNTPKETSVNKKRREIRDGKRKVNYTNTPSSSKLNTNTLNISLRKQLSNTSVRNISYRTILNNQGRFWISKPCDKLEKKVLVHLLKEKNISHKLPPGRLSDEKRSSICNQVQRK